MSAAARERKISVRMISITALVLLARTAAPDSIPSDATVLVLGR